MLHAEKMTTIAEAAFRVKVAEAAFVYSKGVVLGTIVQANGNVKRFTQIVLKSIATSSPAWMDGLAYFTLSTANNITLASTQTQVNTEVATVLPYYAKAEYGDIT